ncbi:DNA starvation/stationary phase protection protein [Nonomuraea sp. NPDC050663]|uniref:DNA starvation/stationary phase protection protein n=1 Tax=Nonomuraea sp. NPDC050663 TaxID=3364370 RepID=UPI0037A61827
MTIISSPLGEAESKLAGEALQGTLVELIDISLVAKQYHWNLVGPRFRSLHLQLDEIVAITRAHADTVAERSVAVGVNPDGRAQTVASAHGPGTGAAGWVADKAVVQGMVRILRASGGRLRERISALSEADPVSQDVLIAVARDLDKQAWMFEAQAAEAG